MEKSEIIKGNKLIAEFMGEVCGEMTIQNKKGSWDFTEYHSSWDWLMPVVEKIDEKCPQHPDFEDADTGRPCTIFDATSSPWKIENTYKTIIEYIEWYNIQNQ
jgi:hypothetical protein